MSGLTRIIIEYRINTPTYIAGADQKEPELRAPSFKGILRWWHRASDARIVDKPSVENKIWGGTDKQSGQSHVFLSVIKGSSSFKKWQWDRSRLARFNQGRGRFTKNGLAYLGYPFGLRGNRDRRAITPGQRFSLGFTIVRENELAFEDQFSIVASLWCFSVLGSCGTRARRGFGSFQPESMTIEGEGAEEWQEIFNKLPVLDQINSPSALKTAVSEAVKKIESHLGRFPEDIAQPHLYSGFQIKILNPHSDWESALNEAGLRLQTFRQRKEPDYSLVKKLLNSPRHGMSSPERVTFGLPLNFRFSRVREAAFYPQRISREQEKPPERLASFLFIKVFKLGEPFYPAFFLMRGAVPGIHVPIRCKINHRSYYLKRAEKNLLEEFFESL